MTGSTRRSMVASVLAAGVLVGGSGMAGASPPETETTTIKDSETFVDVLPFCDEAGALYEITIDYNLVEHSTVSEDGAHFTSPKRARSWPHQSTRRCVTPVGVSRSGVASTRTPVAR